MSCGSLQWLRGRRYCLLDDDIRSWLFTGDIDIAIIVCEWNLGCYRMEYILKLRHGVTKWCPMIRVLIVICRPTLFTWDVGTVGTLRFDDKIDEDEFIGFFWRLRQKQEIKYQRLLFGEAIFDPIVL